MAQIYHLIEVVAEKVTSHGVAFKNPQKKGVIGYLFETFYHLDSPHITSIHEGWRGFARAAIYHEVFDGNQAESPTLMPTLKKVRARFGHIKRLIVVADRGLLSLDNIDELGKITLPNATGGQALEFILAVPGRRCGVFSDISQDFQAKAAEAELEIIEELLWQGLRLVVAHHPEGAKEQTQLRSERIAALEAQAQAWAGKLDGQGGAPDDTQVG